MMSLDKAVTKAEAVEKIVKKCKNQYRCFGCYFFDREDRQLCYLSKLTGDTPKKWRDDNVIR